MILCFRFHKNRRKICAAYAPTGSCHKIIWWKKLNRFSCYFHLSIVSIESILMNFSIAIQFPNEFSANTHKWNRKWSNQVQITKCTQFCVNFFPSWLFIYAPLVVCIALSNANVYNELMIEYFGTRCETYFGAGVVDVCTIVVFRMKYSVNT